MFFRGDFVIFSFSIILKWWAEVYARNVCSGIIKIFWHSTFTSVKPPHFWQEINFCSLMSSILHACKTSNICSFNSESPWWFFDFILLIMDVTAYAGKYWRPPISHTVISLMLVGSLNTTSFYFLLKWAKSILSNLVAIVTHNGWGNWIYFSEHFTIFE